MRACASRLLFNDLTCIKIFNSFRGEFRPSPLAKVGPQKAGAFGFRPLFNLGQVNPWHCGVHVVVQMPIMVEPEPIDEKEGTEIACALLDVPNRPKMMRVLH